MAFDGLDINISASAADATATIASVKSSLGSLERSANDADDSMEELGDSTTSTAARMTGLGTVAGTTAVSMTGLSTAGTGAATSMTALGVSVGTAATALVGIAAVAAPLVATLGAVAAAAGGLAAGFGAVVGSGLLAFGEERAEQNKERLTQINARINELEALEDTQDGLTAAQQRELDQLEEKADKVEETTSVTGALSGVMGDLREEIQPLVSELGQQFIPLIEDTVNAIPDLAESIINALGPLGPFRDALRQFGAAAASAIPNLVSALLDLGRKALPVLGDLLARFGEASDGLLQGFVDIAAQIGDDLIQMGEAVGEILPDLTELGAIIIEAAAPAIDSLLGYVEDAIEAFNRFVRSGDASEIMRSLREEIVPLIPRVKALAAEFRPVIDQFVEELPAIIESVGKFGDSLLDISEEVIPPTAAALEITIGLIGDLARYYNDWVENSEKNERELKASINGIKRDFNNGVAAIKADLRGIAAWVRDTWQLAVNFDTIVSDAIDEAVATVDDGVGLITDYLAVLPTYLTDEWDFISAIGDAVSAAFDEAEGIVEESIGEIQDLLSFDVDVGVDEPTAGQGILPGGPGDQYDDDGDDDGGGGGGSDPSPGSPSVGDGGSGGVSDPRGDPDPPGSGDTSPVSGLATGGFVEQSGLAMIHAGERVVPEAQVSDRGAASLDPASVATGVKQADRTDEVLRKLDTLTQAVRDLNTGEVAREDVLRALDIGRDRRIATRRED